MAFIGDALGIKGANISNPVSPDQLQAAQANSAQGLSQQQALLSALAAQGGLQNQSALYNQLGAIAAGQGPNPAQAQLAQATQNNIAAQAALAAGQRGASQNVGMIQRNAAQQGANLQQQAIGQAANLQAQQSLNALGQQTGIANQQVANRLGQQNAFNQQALGQQGQLIQGQNAFNQAQIQNQGMQNEAVGKIAGGILGGAGAIAGLAHGGAVKKYFSSGGVVPAMVSPGEAYIPPENVKAVAEGKMSVRQGGEVIPGQAKVKGDSLKNDTVPKNLREGGVVVPRTKMKDDKAAERFVAAIMSKSHGKGLK